MHHKATQHVQCGRETTQNARNLAHAFEAWVNLTAHSLAVNPSKQHSYTLRRIASAAACCFPAIRLCSCLASSFPGGFTECKLLCWSTLICSCASFNRCPRAAYGAELSSCENLAWCVRLWPGETLLLLLLPAAARLVRELRWGCSLYGATEGSLDRKPCARKRG